MTQHTRVYRVGNDVANVIQRGTKAHLGGGGGARGAPNHAPANRRPACKGGVGVHQAHDITAAHVAGGADVAALGEGIGTEPSRYFASHHRMPCKSHRIPCKLRMTCVVVLDDVAGSECVE